ncbi:MAG TPA: acyl-CoA carboxylase subunit beta [Thermoleophilaceae bacterium]|nr:acyl-CoA carboxylase subunit beta [Thermoleophilaceae bacterium]
MTIAPHPSHLRVADPPGLTALDRLELLCDPGTVRTIRSAVASRAMGAKARPGDGVVGGSGLVDGRPVYVYAQDASFAGGSLGAAHADTIVRVLQLAREARVPVVGFIESGGARMQEGTAALAGYGRIFREHVLASGLIPQISVICGTSAGGGCYAPALTDFVLMTREAKMFLTGPGVVAEAMGENVTAEELGGPAVHERNGVCQLVTEDDAEAIYITRELLSYLPQNAHEAVGPQPFAAHASGDPGHCVPREARRVYDVRDVIRTIADNGRLLELSERWAKNMVTGFARIEGDAVGVIANQPKFLGGTIDAEAAQKAARFVRTCNSFGLPLVVLVDTPGFLPGSKQESAGVIRHGAKLLHAFAEATVPKLSVVLRKAFGGAYITMNSRDLGADYAFAWPQAEIGVMAAPQAVGIISRREIAGATDPAAARAELADEYAEQHLGAALAAREGFIDEVIAPGETRDRLAWAIASLPKPRTRTLAGNIPL